MGGRNENNLPFQNADDFAFSTITPIVGYSEQNEYLIGKEVLQKSLIKIYESMKHQRNRNHLLITAT